MEVNSSAIRTQSDAQGRFVLPCDDSPLLFADWNVAHLSIVAGGPFAAGPGLGHAYTWTGTGSQLSDATSPGDCAGPTDVHLEVGGAIQITVLGSDENPVSNCPNVCSALLLPAGFSYPVGSNNVTFESTAQSYISGIRPGTSVLAFPGNDKVTCSVPKTTSPLFLPNPNAVISGIGFDVDVQPGKVSQVTCHLQTSP